MKSTRTSSWFGDSSSSGSSQIPYIMGLFISFAGGAMYGYKIGRDQTRRHARLNPSPLTPWLPHSRVGTSEYYGLDNEETAETDSIGSNSSKKSLHPDDAIDDFENQQS
jgi:hypothetical protein